MRLPKSCGSSHVKVPARPEESSSDKGSIVLICDSRESRLEIISRIAMDCGARCLPIAEYEASVKPNPSMQFYCALVALNECPSLNSPDLLTARAFAQEGMAVICYADRTNTWPVGKR